MSTPDGLSRDLKIKAIKGLGGGGEGEEGEVGKEYTSEASYFP